MQTKLITPFALVVGLLAVCSPMFAHHGSVAYDTKVVVLKQATVTKVLWTNPHSFIMFDVKDDKGNVIHWAAEGASPSANTGARNWSDKKVKPGDVITVYLYQAKNGRPVGRIGKLVVADGTEFGDGALSGDRPAQCDKDFGPGGDEASACRPDGKKTTNKE